MFFSAVNCGSGVRRLPSSLSSLPPVRLSPSLRDFTSSSLHSSILPSYCHCYCYYSTILPLPLLLLLLRLLLLISIHPRSLCCSLFPRLAPAHLHPRYALQRFRHYLQGNTRENPLCPRSRLIIDNLLFPSSPALFRLFSLSPEISPPTSTPSSATSPPLTSLSLALYTISYPASIVCAGVPWRPFVRPLECQSILLFLVQQVSTTALLENTPLICATGFQLVWPLCFFLFSKQKFDQSSK